MRYRRVFPISSRVVDRKLKVVQNCCIERREEEDPLEGGDEEREEEGREVENEQGDEER
jgi:hypothetical protein